MRFNFIKWFENKPFVSNNIKNSISKVFQLNISRSFFKHKVALCFTIYNMIISRDALSLLFSKLLLVKFVSMCSCLIFDFCLLVVKQRSWPRGQGVRLQFSRSLSKPIRSKVLLLRDSFPSFLISLMWSCFYRVLAKILICFAEIFIQLANLQSCSFSWYSFWASTEFFYWRS